MLKQWELWAWGKINDPIHYFCETLSVCFLEGFFSFFFYCAVYKMVFSLSNTQQVDMIWYVSSACIKTKINLGAFYHCQQGSMLTLMFILQSFSSFRPLLTSQSSSKHRVFILWFQCTRWESSDLLL